MISSQPAYTAASSLHSQSLAAGSSLPAMGTCTSLPGCPAWPPAAPPAGHSLHLPQPLPSDAAQAPPPSLSPSPSSCGTALISARSGSGTRTAAVYVNLAPGESWHGKIDLPGGGRGRQGCCAWQGVHQRRSRARHRKRSRAAQRAVQVWESLSPASPGVDGLALHAHRVGSKTGASAMPS